MKDIIVFPQIKAIIISLDLSANTLKLEDVSLTVIYK